MKNVHSLPLKVAAASTLLFFGALHAADTPNQFNKTTGTLTIESTQPHNIDLPATTVRDLFLHTLSAAKNTPENPNNVKPLTNSMQVIFRDTGATFNMTGVLFGQLEPLPGSERTHLERIIYFEYRDESSKDITVIDRPMMHKLTPTTINATTATYQLNNQKQPLTANFFALETMSHPLENHFYMIIPLNSPNSWEKNNIHLFPSTTDKTSQINTFKGGYQYGESRSARPKVYPSIPAAENYMLFTLNLINRGTSDAKTIPLEPTEDEKESMRIAFELDQ